MVSLLKKWGHVPVLAGDGKAALTAWEKEPFDLILMDVQMPEVDGFAATKAIRAKESGREHPRPDRRPHRPRDERRPRALPGRRHGRLRLQAHPGRGVFRDHRPITPFAMSKDRKGRRLRRGNREQCLTWTPRWPGLEGDRELFKCDGSVFCRQCPKLLEEIRDSVLCGDGPRWSVRRTS